MSSVQQAYQTQLTNIQAKTGKTLAELRAIALNSGRTKHGELRKLFQEQLGLGYGDANSLVHAVLESDGERAAVASGASTDDVLSEIYSGAKVNLRPIHDALLGQIDTFGGFECAPKKGYVSLRRKKQFAMVGPANNSQIEVGLNIKGLVATSRLVEMPAKSMCQYRVRLTSVTEIDAELLGWLRQAYEDAA
jgi:Domain of unknown function (DUF5655)/Domain of unknown function (DUF4287)